MGRREGARSGWWAGLALVAMLAAGCAGGGSSADTASTGSLSVGSTITVTEGTRTATRSVTVTADPTGAVAGQPPGPTDEPAPVPGPCPYLGDDEVADINGQHTGVTTVIACRPTRSALSPAATAAGWPRCASSRPTRRRRRWPRSTSTCRSRSSIRPAEPAGLDRRFDAHRRTVRSTRCPRAPSRCRRSQPAAVDQGPATGDHRDRQPRPVNRGGPRADQGPTAQATVAGWFTVSNLYATLHTNRGDIRIELFRIHAPEDREQLRRSGQGHREVHDQERLRRDGRARSTTARSSTG